METSGGTEQYRTLKKKLRMWLLIAFPAWTLLTAGSLAWSYLEDREKAIQFATEEAQASYNKDLLYRRWNAGHGGVYVPITDDNQPNPYLDVPNRDLETTDGMRLTLINPAYMTRQVHELSQETFGAKGHITSLKPIRPANAPDPWESEALKKFEAGAKEIVAVGTLNGKDHLRLMRPLITEGRCLKCHEKQGYKEGEVRGGLSVSVPMARFWEMMQEDFRREVAVHLAFWTLGSLVLSFGVILLGKATTRVEEAGEELRLSEEKYRHLTEMSPNPIYIQEGGSIVYVNPALCRLLGAKEPGELLGRNVFEEIIHSDYHELVRKRVASAHSNGLALPAIEEKFRRLDGSLVEVEVTGVSITYQGRQATMVVAADISERLESQREREELQAQVMQSQKVESIGRLAGGVAHDFNNMLGVIIGHAELALSSPDTPGHLREDLQEIQTAAKRSAEITRQLLAFARKQTIAPKVLNLNDLIANLLKMIRRLIGEDIDLLWKPGVNLMKVRMDPSQIDQLMANLATNARDAIDGVGKVTIETSNTLLDEAYCAEHPGFRPGRYVLISVSDDGCGIEPERLTQIFEPFYTTKEVGAGTGLGLATVFGIVKQNGGFINVYSEPGVGTTFKIYLCGLEGEEGVSETETVMAPRGGTETILLVEDEKANLRLGEKILTSLGYRVLTAGSPGQALKIAEETRAPIHLLITDVVMPGMNGKDLAARLLATHPAIKCLYMSGYTANVIAHRGVLDEGVNFLSKPFTLVQLAAKVRQVLET